MCGNRRQRLGHAVDERLDPDEADTRVHLRLADQVFAAAEADLEPHLVDGRGKQRAQIFRRNREIECDLREQRLKQRRPGGCQSVALAPAEKGARSPRFAIDVTCQRTARLRASARSVFSQEKPPSFSDARPKCP